MGCDFWGGAVEGLCFLLVVVGLCCRCFVVLLEECVAGDWRCARHGVGRGYIARSGCVCCVVDKVFLIYYYILL